MDAKSQIPGALRSRVVFVCCRGVSTIWGGCVRSWHLLGSYLFPIGAVGDASLAPKPYSSLRDALVARKKTGSGVSSPSSPGNICCCVRPAVGARCPADAWCCGQDPDPAQPGCGASAGFGVLLKCHPSPAPLVLPHNSLLVGIPFFLAVCAQTLVTSWQPHVWILPGTDGFWGSW